MQRLLLTFPTVVVLLASVAFCLGGHCAGWQWWVAAAIAIVSGFWRRPAREGVRTGLIFLAWMAVVWIGCGLAVASNWFDESAYHIPAVRMLADGWNPLYVRTPESVLRFAGLAVGDCRIDHIVFLPKIVWVFDAVAFHFTGDIFNPMEPVLWFLFPAVSLHVWRAMEGAHVAWKILSVPFLYCLQFNSAYVIDSVVALSAIGLFLSFEEALSGKRVDILSLAVYSFWMMGAKTTGLAHGMLFWAVFLLFAFWRKGVAKQILKRIAVAISLIFLMLVVACASPFLTSAIDYGHPLYPQYTFDDGRSPAREMAYEFAASENNDAAQMGYVGRYVNAFVSPSLARTWYRWRLDKPTFSPESAVWRHYPTDGDGTSPTRPGVRIAFWFSTLLLLFAARPSFRPIALMVLLGIGSVPPRMLGYIRYIPWWLAPTLLLYVDSVRRQDRLRQVLAFMLVSGVFLLRPYTLFARLVHVARLVDDRSKLTALLDIRAKLPPIRPCDPMFAGQLKFMRRHVPEIGNAELRPFSPVLAEKFRRDGVELPGRLFVFDDMDEMRRHASFIPMGKLNCVKHLVRVFALTVPRLVAGRIGSAFGASSWKEVVNVQ